MFVSIIGKRLWDVPDALFFLNEPENVINMAHGDDLVITKQAEIIGRAGESSLHHPIPEPFMPKLRVIHRAMQVLV